MAWNKTDMKIIFTIGIFASLFYSVLLFSKKDKSLPDKVLGIWMLVIGLHLINYYLVDGGFWEVYPHLIGVTAPFPFFYGPLLYIYVYYSIHNFQLRKKDYLHFLPIVLTYAYMFRFFFFYSAEEKKLVDQGLIDDFDMFSNILLVGILLSGILYAVFTYRLLNQYKILIQNNFSNIERIDLNWFKSFIWGVGLIFLTVAIVLISTNILGFVYPFNPEYIFYSMLVFAILSLGYFGIRHQNIFVDNVVVEIETEERSKAIYKSSSLKDDMATVKHKDLTDLMETQKPFLEPDLTLSSLAGLLNIPPHHLSQIINQFEEQNFNDYINKYRVQEFIDRAAENSNFSFLALALDSGFNSKSTFNTVFKKHKGLTPSQFFSSNLN